ncbi:hypothetical protein P4601_01750 [Peribacillus frigoritolerans]|uniref:hypothetical protein n=1 Tax=Peribacillus frigoritolerans TaxID=450367 RepID=UPI001140C452|nr:hypothetical protein [Peribacillus frigoritolerans]MED3709068.1 hypothetical protein [Peribacillus frigoritolerans]MED3888671.1 hypothetical protein [Peribacillus frigoritolerans]ULM98155.1 hypothetical protein L8956_05400 [Peribacillus frigoritolerans]
MVRVIMRAPLPFIKEGCCRLASGFNVPNGIGEEEVFERFCKDIFDSRFPGKESGNETGVSQLMDVKPVAMDMDKGIGFLNEVLYKIAY